MRHVLYSCSGYLFYVSYTMLLCKLFFYHIKMIKCAAWICSMNSMGACKYVFNISCYIFSCYSHQFSAAWSEASRTDWQPDWQHHAWDQLQGFFPYRRNIVGHHATVCMHHVPLLPSLCSTIRPYSYSDLCNPVHIGCWSTPCMNAHECSYGHVISAGCRNSAHCHRFVTVQVLTFEATCSVSVFDEIPLFIPFDILLQLKVMYCPVPNAPECWWTKY